MFYQTKYTKYIPLHQKHVPFIGHVFCRFFLKGYLSIIIDNFAMHFTLID